MTATPAPAASGQAGTGGKGGGARCRTSRLRASLGSKGTYQGANDLQVVDLTNTGPVPCTLYGFPGVNLVGTVGAHQGYQWPLRRSGIDRPVKVTLAPGGTAHFDLVYLAWGSGTAGQEISVDEIVLTPPDDRAQTRLTWKQAILLQDAATRPGTWIQPVRPGA